MNSPFQAQDQRFRQLMAPPPQEVKRKPTTSRPTDWQAAYYMLKDFDKKSHLEQQAIVAKLNIPLEEALKYAEKLSGGDTRNVEQLSRDQVNRIEESGAQITNMQKLARDSGGAAEVNEQGDVVTQNAFDPSAGIGALQRNIAASEDTLNTIQQFQNKPPQGVKTFNEQPVETMKEVQSIQSAFNAAIYKITENDPTGTPLDPEIDKRILLQIFQRSGIDPQKYGGIDAFYRNYLRMNY